MGTKADAAVEAAVNAAIEAEVPAPVAELIEPPVDTVLEKALTAAEQAVVRDYHEAANYVRAHFGHHPEVAEAIIAQAPIDVLHAIVAEISPVPTPEVAA